MCGYHRDAREPALRTIGLQDRLDALHEADWVVSVAGTALEALSHAA